MRAITVQRSCRLLGWRSVLAPIINCSGTLLDAF